MFGPLSAPPGNPFQTVKYIYIYISLRGSSWVQQISYRHRVCVVYLELSGFVVVKSGPRGEEVQEHLQQIHVLARHIWDLENGTHPKKARGQWWIEKEQKKNICFGLTLEERKYRCLERYYLSELKLDAVTTTSSLFWTSTGIFLQPGDFNNLCSNFSVSVTTKRGKKNQQPKIKNKTKMGRVLLLGTRMSTSTPVSTDFSYVFNISVWY